MLLSGNVKGAVISFLMALPIILFSLSLHEAAHAYVAYKLGDPTARNIGRMTLNPFKHLNLFGFLSMLLVGIGWANPVPINARNFKNPRNGMAISALAGPVSNFLLGIVFAIASAVLLSLELFDIIPLKGELYIYGSVPAYYGYMFLYYGATLNLSLAVFNMIPAPPFDGSRILYVFLPPKYYFKVMKYERYIGMGILVAFIFLSNVGIDLLGMIIDPIIDLIYLLFGVL